MTSFIKVRGQDGRVSVYAHSLMEVRTRDANGIPRLMDYCPDEEMVNLRVRKDFVTAFVRADVFGITVRDEVVEAVVDALKCFGARRSHKWPAVEHRVLAARPECDWCLRPSTVGHHVVPFHVAPELELVESNIGACCDTCHAVQAHFVYRWDLYDECYWENAKAFKARLIAAKEKQRGKR